MTPINVVQVMSKHLALGYHIVFSVLPLQMGRSLWEPRDKAQSKVDILGSITDLLKSSIYFTFIFIHILSIFALNQLFFSIFT